MRLIDADALKEMIIDAYNAELDCRHDEKFMRLLRDVSIAFMWDIDETPTVDAIPIVRCKDCRYCIKEDEWTLWCMSASPACLTTPEDYCSHGKRKENQE